MNHLPSSFRLLAKFTSSELQDHGPILVLTMSQRPLSAPRGHPQLPAMWSTHRPSLGMVATSSKPAKGNLLLQFANLIQGMMSSHLPHSTGWKQVPLKGKGLYKGLTHWGSPVSVSATSTYFVCQAQCTILGNTKVQREKKSVAAFLELHSYKLGVCKLYKSMRWSLSPSLFVCFPLKLA